MKKILTIISLLASFGLSSGFGQNTPECYDLNDNQVPQGWIFDHFHDSSDISNGRLNAYILDGIGMLKKTITTPSDSIICEWDGSLYYSYWCNSTGLYITVDSNIYQIDFIDRSYSYGTNMALQVILNNNGNNPIITIQAPFDSANYHYTVKLYDKKIHFKSVRLTDNFVAFDTLVSDPSLVNFKIKQIDTIGFLAHAATDNNAWLDNPCITIYSSASNNCLVAYYPFNGNANDESENRNNGTVYGTTLTTDRFGNANQAYSFNGTSNYIQISNSSSMQIPTAFSFCFWVYIEGWTNNEWEEIIFKGAEGSDIQPFLISLHSWDGINIVYNNTYIKPSITSLPMNLWYFVATTYDGNTCNVYINNMLAGSNAYKTSLGNDANDWYIGWIKEDKLSFNGFFNGVLDDISIYNCALDSAKIDSLFHIGGWTGIKEVVKNNNEISIYPNPANDNITIESTSSNNNKDEMISIYNLQGQLLLEQPMLQAKINIDIAKLVRGMYFVEVKTEKGVAMKKFLKE